MEHKDYTDYNIADLPEDDILNIMELENTLRKKTNKEVVLIAYQQTSKAEQ
ncbi:MAG: hypothetical protein K0S76_227 [Herbinix sp.]|jgi:hypothetical protein|nr:hypothetical protein [Herbinix sp.]